MYGMSLDHCVSQSTAQTEMCMGAESVSCCVFVTIVCLSADRYNLIVSTTLIMIVQTMPNNT